MKLEGSTAIFMVEKVRIVVEGERVKPLKLPLPERFYSFAHVKELARVVKALKGYGTVTFRKQGNRVEVRAPGAVIAQVVDDGVESFELKVKASNLMNVLKAFERAKMEPWHIGVVEGRLLCLMDKIGDAMAIAWIASELE